MSEDKMLNNLNEINEIVLSNTVCEDLSFGKVSDDKVETKKKYKEVLIPNLSLITGNVSQTVLQVANQGMTLAQIAKLAPNGLFAATTNPANLSKFANGTYTTMVRDVSGNLVKHAGFADVGLSVSVNPALIISAGMQAMSAVSGTYYLHEVFTQMKDLDAKLEKLLNNHHDTDVGSLINARKGLYEISNREFVDTTDLNDIRNLKKTTGEIHEKYMSRLKRLKSNSNSKIGGKAEEQELQDINLTLKIALEADKLSLYAELIEIGTRMKIGGPIEITNGLIKQLKKNYANSFYRNSDLEVEKTYLVRQKLSSDDLVEKKKEFERSFDELKEFNTLNNLGKLGLGINIGKDYWNGNKAKKKMMLEDNYKSKVKTDMKQNKESDRIGNIIDEIVELPHKETEILYIPSGNNKLRVFVTIEGE